MQPLLTRTIRMVINYSTIHTGANWDYTFVVFACFSSDLGTSKQFVRKCFDIGFFLQKCNGKEVDLLLWLQTLYSYAL